MLDQAICDYLEYYIGDTLSKSADIDRRRCWCDGIYMPDSREDYSIETVTRTNQILTKAWIDEGRIQGKTRGQFKYVLVIHFGDKAIANYKNGLSLKECLPKQDTDDWITLDRNKRVIEIQLL